jgi:hypothetical protein
MSNKNGVNREKRLLLFHLTSLINKYSTQMLKSHISWRHSHLSSGVYFWSLANVPFLAQIPSFLLIPLKECALPVAVREGGIILPPSVACSHETRRTLCTGGRITWVALLFIILFYFYIVVLESVKTAGKFPYLAYIGISNFLYFQELWMKNPDRLGCNKITIFIRLLHF